MKPTIKKCFLISGLLYERRGDPVGRPHWAHGRAPLRLTLALLGMLSLGITVPSYAQTATTTVPHIFKAGDDASADQVNQNFKVLADGINNVSKEVDDLQKGITVDSEGNVGIGTTTLAAKLEVNGDFIRTIPRAAGYGDTQTDNGPLGSRVLNFTKKQSDTGIRVTYIDNFRVLNNEAACSWEIKFNGASCTNPGALRYDKFEGGTNSNRHNPATVFGTCFDILAGPVRVDVWVGTTAGRNNGDCYTGWVNQYWSLGAEEVR